MIPEEFGGPGLGIREAAVILEEINRSGGNGAACHAQMYTMGTLLRHGSEEQKRRWLPDVAAGKTRLQAFAVTEPDAGSDTTSHRPIMFSPRPHIDRVGPALHIIPTRQRALDKSAGQCRGSRWIGG